MMLNTESSSRPLVSVVTPAYNQASFLRETIESVLAQDYPHIEYIVLDDGSTDDTPKILAEYSGRITWESHSNRGQTATINKGWAMSRGDILIWLNSDDTLLPGAVSRAVEYLKNHPEVGILFGESMFTEADGTPINESKAPGFFDYLNFVVGCRNPISQPSAYLRRAVYEDLGELDPHYFYFMDWDYWLRAGLRYRIANVPDVLSTYRLHAASNTVSQARRAAPELEYMYQKFFNREDLPKSLRRRQRQAMANMYFTSAGYYLKGGDTDSGLRMGAKALRTYPELIARPSMLHKLAYCFAGRSRLYRSFRASYYRVRDGA